MEGEEAAEATAGDYQREAAEKDLEYDSTASALERKRQLNAPGDGAAETALEEAKVVKKLNG